MQQHFGDRRVLAGMALVALLLGFAGPFGTFGQLRFWPRLVYWAAMVVCTSTRLASTSPHQGRSRRPLNIGCAPFLVDAFVRRGQSRILTRPRPAARPGGWKPFKPLIIGPNLPLQA